jgi:hypothetical protein
MGERMQILLMNREGSERNDWEITFADVKPSELCWQAALNEVRMDTSYVPDRVYSVDKVEVYYDVKTHAVMLAPVFVAFFDFEQDTKPMLPDVNSMWIDAYEAEKHLPLVTQRDMVKLIYHEFFTKNPADSLKVYPTRF